MGLDRQLDPVRIDQGVAVLLLVEMAVQLSLDPHVAHRTAEAAAALVVAGGVALRRRFPMGALLAGLAAVSISSALGGRLPDHTVGPTVAVVLLFYGAGAFLPERRAWLALALGLIGFTVLSVVTSAGISNGVFNDGALGAAPWILGRMVRLRSAAAQAQRELAEGVDAEREQHARAQALGERTRIARELHDVIAHSVSVMVVQAGGARVVMGSDLDRADSSLRAVELAGREALAEMRRLLGVLDDGQDPRALAPQPGLADVPVLIARARAAGLAAELAVEGEQASISPGLDLTAYRIVQEALTNAVKHAGRVPASVRIHWGDDALELEISDAGGGRRSGAAEARATGHGIPGMRERVALQGGTIHIGHRNGGGFRVCARLPLAQGAA
jgi:signal transduction histidine kinase